MKAVYETPNVNFEALMADNSIAASCPGINNQGEVTFSCMFGTNTDPVKVVHQDLVDTCTAQAGFQKLEYIPEGEKKAVKFAGIVNQDTGFGHSGNTDYFKFDSMNIDGLDDDNEMVATFTQTGLDSMMGFLYYCTNFVSSHWGAKKYGDDWYWEHGGHADEKGLHVQFAPVFSSNINS